MWRVGITLRSLGREHALVWGVAWAEICDKKTGVEFSGDSWISRTPGGKPLKKRPRKSGYKLGCFIEIPWVHCLGYTQLSLFLIVEWLDWLALVLGFFGAPLAWQFGIHPLFLGCGTKLGTWTPSLVTQLLFTPEIQQFSPLKKDGLEEELPFLLRIAFPIFGGGKIAVKFSGVMFFWIFLQDTSHIVLGETTISISYIPSFWSSYSDLTRRKSPKGSLLEGKFPYFRKIQVGEILYFG